VNELLDRLLEAGRRKTAVGLLKMYFEGASEEEIDADLQLATSESGVKKVEAPMNFDKYRRRRGPVKEGEDVHARFVRQHREEQERDVKGYDPKHVLASAEDGEFRVEIHDNHREFTIRKADPSHPVPGGWWMGFWDDDLQEVLGIDQKNYDRMSTEEKAKADAQVQLKKYAHEQYWDKFAEFYHRDEYEKRGRSGTWQERNKYWKKRLHRTNEARFLEPRGGSKGGEAGDYFYHTTTRDSLYDIIADGELIVGRPQDSEVWTDEPQQTWPDGSTQRRSYWSDSEAGTVDFSRPQAVVVRVAKTSVPNMKEESTGDFYMTKPVDADLLEVLTDGGWVRLNQLKESINGGRLTVTVDERPERTFFVGYENSGHRSVARATIEYKGDDAYIHWIEANPKGSGYGSELLLFVIEHVKLKGAKSLSGFIEFGNDESVRMFKSAGFEEYHRSKRGCFWKKVL